MRDNSVLRSLLGLSVATVVVVGQRSLLYGLHAILKLHTAQEDENYLSLADEPKQERPVGAPR